MSAKKHGMAYRPDIDGLRAVAVIPVILFHGGVKYVSGGFVGVDIFFVISGFLIGNIIYTEINDSRFSLLSFYNRRIRRIFPMLFVIQIFCTIGAFIWFLPNQLLTFGKSLLFTSAFASNIWFWSQAGYFAAPSELMPLLHTWSLAVEEQFYIFFPLLLLLVSSNRRLLFYSILAILGLSFALCVYLTARSPGVAFFLIPTRAWELLAGSALAIIPCPDNLRLKRALPPLGLAMILYAIVAFDQFTPFPGAAAALPVLGATMIIYGAERSIVGAILSKPALVLVGRMSYSLYLWHWPIFVFLKQARADVEFTLPVLAFGVGLTFLLSYFSWKYIETPCRKAPVEPSIVFGAAISATLFAISPALLALAGHGFPQRFTAEALSFTKTAYSEQGEACLAKSARDPASLCSIGSGPASFLLWGDLHSGAILPAVQLSAVKAGRSGIFAGFNSCPPLLTEAKYLRGSDKDNCRKRTSLMIDLIGKNDRIKTIIMTAFWAKYAIGDEDLRTVVSAAPGKEIVILDDLPTPGFDVPWVLGLKGGISKPISPPDEPAAFKSARTWPNVRVIRLSEALCDESSCAPTRDGKALYSDGNHVSQYAAEVVLAPFLDRKGLLQASSENGWAGK